VDTATILYDRDCGFCRWSLAKLLVWDRADRLHPLPIQSAEGQRLLADVPEHERLESWHLVDATGRVSSGGDAFPAVFRLLPGGRPLGAVAAAAPGASRAAYWLVARSRSFLGRCLSRRAIERATARIDARGPQDTSFASGASCGLPDGA
jgi:predicted DCC family thiol-disulfide oxidoreductase YuxK